MSDHLEQVMRETRQYYYEDGLVEIAVGGLIAASSALIFVMSTVSQNSPLRWIAGGGLPLLTIVGGLVVKRLVRLVKERVTYPRTGYVTYHQRGDQGRWWIVAVALIGAVALALLPDWMNRMSLVVGTLLAVVLAYLGYRAGLLRMYGVAAIALIVGFGAALLRFDEAVGTVITFAVVGMVLMAAGIWALLRYLRSNPAPQED